MSQLRLPLRMVLILLLQILFRNRLKRFAPLPRGQVLTLPLLLLALLTLLLLVLLRVSLVRCPSLLFCRVRVLGTPFPRPRSLSNQALGSPCLLAMGTGRSPLLL